jgi:long-chain acyl-CoA synthetase
MPTLAEVQEQLTGPGGAFEVVTETVNGVEMKVYKERMRALRQVAEMAIGRGNDQPFLVYGDRRYGFQEFVELTNSVAHALRDQYGLQPGDRVSVLSANSPEWCLAFWGIVNDGAICVGLNAWWTTDEIVYGLQDSGSKILIADSKRFERIAAHLDEAPDLEAVFLTDIAPPAGDPRLHSFSELLGDPRPDFPDVEIAEDDLAVIFYTSGTTGRPKGAISTHRSMIANLQNTMFGAIATAMSGSSIFAAGGGGAQMASLLTSPLFHVSGCHSGLVVGLMLGIKLVIPEGRFDPEKVLGLIQDEKISVWATVPTMVWRVCEYPGRHDYDTSSVSSVAYGGSPSADELQRKVKETFPNVASMTNAYGLTESSSVATSISGQDFVDRPTSVGRAMPVVDIQVVDPDMKPVPTGQTGEVVIKGPIIMPGYWNKPEATAKTIVDGWLLTGDIGRIDEDGFLYITDRAKDMIIRGGENIYCVEIENRLVENPAIADAAVIGVPHPELGEEVKAVVQVEPGEKITEDEVRQWVADGLAYFKVPTYVAIQAEKLPRNASGKLLKNVLRGEGEVTFAETL